MLTLLNFATVLHEDVLCQCALEKKRKKKQSSRISHVIEILFVSMKKQIKGGPFRQKGKKETSFFMGSICSDVGFL